MSQLKRRQFLKGIGMGSAGIAAGAVPGSFPAAQNIGRVHEHDLLDGPLATATVSFGAWPVNRTEPLDRMETPDAPIAPNAHVLIPNTVTIRAGGTVNFIVAGFHQIVVYAPGKKPSDVNTSMLIPLPPPIPPEVALIDDPDGRVYRGLNPADLPQDRVEAVQFDRRGLHLVICAVNVHFADDMFGWVMVLP
ncbi:MAG TPA: twin-arginine translocation signal domain-containing protein [Gammaproteobacteria bacterium]